MKVIYDPETDTLSIIFRTDNISESDEVKNGVIIDYAKDGSKVYQWKSWVPPSKYRSRGGYCMR